jgi:DNA-binding NarL/FixJ family response regulator
MTPIRIVVVDDHAVFREGIRSLLARVDDIQVVGEAGTTEQAIQVTADTEPDVVLMDLNIPGGGGEAATAAILANQPGVAILVLTMHTDDQHLRRALHAGARGYLVKDAEPDAIIRSIAAVHDGQVIFSPDIGAHLIAATATGPDEERPFPNLTPRELEVLDRLARGLRNDAIAARMGISTKTVQNTISAILLKLGAIDRAQAVAIARDAGLGTRP